MKFFRYPRKLNSDKGARGGMGWEVRRTGERLWIELQFRFLFFDFDSLESTFHVSSSVRYRDVKINQEFPESFVPRVARS